jgi:hypothetical protein
MKNIELIHQIWTLIESTSWSFLLNTDEQRLVDGLVNQLTREHQLSSAAIEEVRQYLQARVPLLRDIAQANRVYTCPMLA